MAFSKKIARTLAAAAFLCTASGIWAAAVQDRHELILLHTGDRHGAILAENERGGLAQQAAFVKAVKAVNENVLLLDSGDFNRGSVLSGLFNAEPDITAYNMMGYDAVTFGCHEFDSGLSNLEKQIEIANFAFISSNIKTPEGDFLGDAPYIVKDYPGFSVGIFAITTNLAARYLHEEDSRIWFEDEIEAAQRVVDTLRNFEKVDIVIGLTHLGIIQELPGQVTAIDLAGEVAGIDIIVDGYSHAYINQPIYTGHTYIVTADSRGRFIGQGRIVIKGKKLDLFEWQPITIGPDYAMRNMIAGYLVRAEDIAKKPIGEAASDFEFGARLPRYGETAIADIVSDAAVWGARNITSENVDFALLPSGLIKAGLPAGTISQEDVLSVLPYDTDLVVVSLTGGQVLELFDALEEVPQGDGGFPAFSKEVRWNLIYSEDGTAQSEDITIGGEPVNLNYVYRVCVPAGVSGMYEGYAVFDEAAATVRTALVLPSALTEYIRAAGTVAPELDGRLTVQGGVLP